MGQLSQLQTALENKDENSNNNEDYSKQNEMLTKSVHDEIAFQFETDKKALESKIKVLEAEKFELKDEIDALKRKAEVAMSSFQLSNVYEGRKDKDNSNLFAQNKHFPKAQAITSA